MYKQWSTDFIGHTTRGREYTFIDLKGGKCMYESGELPFFHNEATARTTLCWHLVLQADVGAESECLAGGLDSEGLDGWVSDGLGNLVSERLIDSGEYRDYKAHG